MKRSYVCRLVADERGSAVVLTCLFMIVFLGCAALVTDFGLHYRDQLRMVNAADAAALAGAGELSPAGSGSEEVALETARQCALENGVPSDGLEVYITNGLSGQKNVCVNAEKKVDFILAPFLGYSSATVQAASSAAVTGVTSCRGVAPLLLRKQDFQFGQRYTLKYGDPEFPGNFGALALGGTGADIYRQNLIFGYGGKIAVGDILKTEPGNMAGPTQAIDRRLERCARNCTIDDFEPGCPKILIIPVYAPDSLLAGRGEVKVESFAAFLVDRAGLARDEIEGCFVRIAAEGDADFSPPGDFGLYAVRLLE